ncbi:hypothetical protein GOFOIKOB_5694 [Methylobacterium tardum]|uniref:O-GlcNAc transferase C-terminal domain-containing protein n=1 Tax=Methylobacterium tardum TaxID=374432 RepID=A0AA37TAW0_9HYPH|nr:hypothetical protein [Methylobacterium tardum]GJE52621.1 hypothetical protein GOFOIKOB_5694 [Methylobacterium tardum]GLS69905.1 hypothetical protein GCM10007890_19180 [Methylobacterium tardum]
MSLDITEQVLAGSLRELHACLRVWLADGAPVDAKLAADARDRWIGLVSHHQAESALALLAKEAGAVFFAIAHEPRVLDAIFQLPAPSERVRDAWGALAQDDPRRLLGGIFLCPPFDLDGLEYFVAQGRFDNILLIYATWQPRCFETDAQRARFVAYGAALGAALADRIESATGPLNTFLDHSVRSIGGGIVYSCEGMLVEHARAKSRVIRAYLKRRHGLDPAKTSQTERLPRGPTIRIGLLWADTDWRTENIVGAASVDRLRDHGFHIVSIIHHNRPATKDRRTMEGRIAALSHEVVDLSRARGLMEQAEAIKALDLDCLMFMTNVTHGYNDYIALATLRLARWQAVNLCAVVTTAFPAIDLYISGLLSERAERPQDGYTEALVRLPGSCLVFDRQGEGRKHHSAKLSFQRLRDPSTVTLFGSGANFYKIHPALTDTWTQILAETQNSRLVLYPFNPNWSSDFAGRRFLRRFSDQLIARGVDPARVTVAGPWRDAGVVADLLSEVDIYLDSFPHSGGLSSLDALRLNIPIVTKGGPTQRENQTADLLDLMGLSRYVADSVDGYLRTACILAEDLSAWAAFKVGIARGMRAAPFFDTVTYSARLATALRSAVVAPAARDSEL